MTPPGLDPSWLVPVAIGALVVWRIAARLRRLVGRQPLSRVRSRLAAVLFPLLLAMLLVSTRGHPAPLGALLGGIVVGIGLGVFALKLTTFEQNETGLYYTPNTALGVGLALLFLGRIGWRFLHLHIGGSDLGEAAPDELTRSPLTLAIFATLAAYYASYATGLLRWAARQPPFVPEIDTVPSTQHANLS